MSKLAAIAILPLLGGTAAVVAWNLSLQEDLESLRAEVAGLSGAEPATADRGAERRSRSGEKAPELAELQHRIRVIEQKTAEAALVEAFSAPGSPAEEDADAGPELTPDDLPSVYRSGEFALAVEGVLDAREERRRKERLAKQAEKLAENALRNLEVTDTQRGDFQRLTLDFLTRREQIRRDRNASDEERRQRAQSLDEERRTSLAALFDDDQLAQIEKRLGRRGLRAGFGSRIKAKGNDARPRKRRPEKRQPRRGGDQDS